MQTNTDTISANITNKQKCIQDFKIMMNYYDKVDLIDLIFRFLLLKKLKF